MATLIEVPATRTATPSTDVPALGTQARVKWGQVIAFVVLAYGLAWSAWAVIVPHLTSFLSASRTPSEPDLPAAVILGMYAPAAAAVIMRRFISKEPLRTSLGPVRHRLRYFAVALIAPALTIALLINLSVGFHLAHFHAGANVVALVVGLGLNALTLNAVFAFGEEYGWRGYLLPKLLPLGEVRAAVIVGLIWGVWHAPLLIAGLNYPGVNPWVAVAMFVPTAVLMSLLFTRVYVAAGCSVLVATVLHGSLNAYGDGLGSTERFITDHVLLTSPGGVIAIGVFAVIAVVVYRLRSRRQPAHPR